MGSQERRASCSTHGTSPSDLIVRTQSTLFGVESGAILDQSERYRYRLWREWNGALPTLLFVMLNPSTADELAEDNTLRRCLGFARQWGYGRVEIVNLFAFRATDPARLVSASDPVGPENDAQIRAACATAQRVVAAWGAHPITKRRTEQVAALIGPQIDCLGVTRQGCPRHPLYVRADAPLMRFRLEADAQINAKRPVPTLER